MRDPYVYPNSEVLINKPGITEDDKLKEVEANYTSMRVSHIIENLLTYLPGPKHLYQLFSCPRGFTVRCL